MKKKSLMYFTNMQFRFLVQETDKKTLAYWAIHCAEHVLHYFEDEFPKDKRLHVARHSLGAAIYASKAIYEDTHSQEEAEVEGKWHYQRLQDLNGNGMK